MSDTKAHLNGSEKTESKAQPQRKGPRWTLVSHVSLSAALYQDQDGVRELRYSAHRMDMASRRMIPTLLGVGTGPCPHHPCHLATAFQLYMEVSGDSGEPLDADDLHLMSGTVQLPIA